MNDNLLILDPDNFKSLGTLQKNLKFIYNTYGSMFLLKYSDKINLKTNLNKYITISGKDFFVTDKDIEYLEKKSPIFA